MSTFSVTLQPSGHVFTAEQGENVLAAALRHGFVLPYGCKNGACGSCKATLVAGEVDYGTYQVKALTEVEKTQLCKVLLCQAQPLGDITLEVRTVGSSKDIPIKTLPCRIQKLERVTDDVIILQLKLPANERLQFLAGQYLEFLLKDGSRRSFSMGNPPYNDELIELHVRHVPGGQFTDHVFGRMKERDILRFEGPHGTFFLRDQSDKPVVFVVSGTGFAPIKSILEQVFARGMGRPMTLYWGGRRPKDLYMHELASQWAAEYPFFKYVPVISEALPEDAWQGRAGFVHRAVMEDHPDLSGYQVYACGVPIMVDSAKKDFIEQCRLPEDEFYADSFTTQADLAAF